MLTSGLFIGKFMPPHSGHELAITTASDVLDELLVLVCGLDTDIIPVTLRYTWLVEQFKHKTNVTFKIFYDNIPEGKKDAEGTVVDEDFWEAWIKVFKEYAPNITHFVSSDLYGKKAAQRLDIEWLCIDPKREVIPISATKIRENLYNNFDYIIDSAKPYFSKTIAIVGAESCGKSTTIRSLSEKYFTLPEYGRIYTENIDNLSDKDFKTIAAVQDSLIKNAANNRLVITDTEAIITYLYSRVYLGHYIEEIKEIAANQNINLYIVLTPNVPWINDGTRIMSNNTKRWIFNYQLVKLLNELDKNYVIVDTPTFINRTEKVQEKISEFIENSYQIK